jgi:hypothetical protein
LKRWQAIASCCVIFCAAPRVRAQTAAEMLGARGTWSLGGSAGLTYDSHHWVGTPLNDSTTWSVWVSPAVSFFVVRDFAIGIAARLERSESVGETVRILDDGLGADALLSYHVALSREVSLLPRLAPGLARVTRAFAPSSGEVYPQPTMGLNDRSPSSYRAQVDELLGGDKTVVHVELYVPLVFTPAPYFYCGVGPYVDWTYAISGNLLPRAHDWLLSFGASTVIGTWF